MYTIDARCYERNLAKPQNIIILRCRFYNNFSALSALPWTRSRRNRCGSSATVSCIDPRSPAALRMSFAAGSAGVRLASLYCCSATYVRLIPRAARANCWLRQHACSHLHARQLLLVAHSSMRRIMYYYNVCRCASRHTPRSRQTSRPSPILVVLEPRPQCCDAVL